MNSFHLLQIAFAAMAVVTAFIFVFGLIVKWRYALGWGALGDLVLYGVCGMLFGVAMAGGIVGVVEFALHFLLAHSNIALCLPGTRACVTTTTADLRDLVARIFLTGTALLGALGTMRLRLNDDSAAVSGKPVAQP